MTRCARSGQGCVRQRVLEQGVDANLDPHGPALGMVWSGDPLAGDKELGGPQRPARSEVWTEGMGPAVRL